MKKGRHDDDWKGKKPSKPPGRGGVLKSILKLLCFCSAYAEG
jgi:hypothetical protein